MRASHTGIPTAREPAAISVLAAQAAQLLPRAVSATTHAAGWLALAANAALALVMAAAAVLAVIALATAPAQAAPGPHTGSTGGSHPAVLGTPGAAAAANAGDLLVLSYHEVRDEVRDYPDPYAVDSAALVGQFSWLRGNGYTPVSLQQVIDARAGGKPLPPKAVLLTFDDGYLSFYTRAYPLLRQFNYPALLAVVGRWIDEPGSGESYGEAFARPGVENHAQFPSWEQLREMVDSGLIEIASHSYDLHRGVPANPQGNVQPAATTRIYDAATNRYETDAQWRERVRADLTRNSEVIAQHTGKRPRAMVWPYGAYGGELMAIATEAGMPVGVTLDNGPNNAQVPLAQMRRMLVMNNPTLAEFAGELSGTPLAQPVRVVEVSLDAIADPEPAVQEQKLSALLDRVRLLAPTHVFLRAFSDTEAGRPEIAEGVGQPYYPTLQGARRADLFNRVAWQLNTRCDVKVIAALPGALATMDAARADGLVEDLARNAEIDGIYFMPSLGAPAVGGKGGRGEAPVAQPLPQSGTQTTAFVVATARMTAVARRWRAPVTVLRGIAQEEATAQQLAVLAQGAEMVVLHSARAGLPPRELLTALPPPAPVGRESPRLVLMLDARAEAGPAQAAGLANRMRALKQAGVIDFGYRDDSFLQDRSELAHIAPALSVRDTTYLK